MVNSIPQDISLQIGAPPIHFDVDVGVELPSCEPQDGMGLIWSRNKDSHLPYNYLLVQLARLQNEVIKLLYSKRSTESSIQNRQGQSAQVQHGLDQWYRSIPDNYKIHKVSEAVGVCELIHLTSMYNQFLSTILILHGVFYNNLVWINALKLGRQGVLQILSSETTLSRSEEDDVGYIYPIDIATKAVPQLKEVVTAKTNSPCKELFDLVDDLQARAVLAYQEASSCFDQSQLEVAAELTCDDTLLQPWN